MKLWGCGKELENGQPERKVQHATERSGVEWSAAPGAEAAHFRRAGGGLLSGGAGGFIGL